MKITSSEPFWLLKNGLIKSYPSLRQDEACDVLVIGAGITGALVAHALVRAGYDVVMTDKRHVATGSTAATTSMLQYEIDVPLFQLSARIGNADAVASYKACENAIGTLGDLVREIGSDCGFSFKESLYLAHHESKKDWLFREYNARAENGFEVQWLTEKDLLDAYGIVAPAAILSASGGSVDAYRLTHDLLAYNQAKGLRIYDHTYIVQTRNETRQSICTTADGRQIKANHVVFCTGYETRKLLKEPIVKLFSTYACVSEPGIVLKDKLLHTLAWDTANPYSYLRATDDGRLLIGGADQPFKNPFLRDQLLDYKCAQLKERLKTLAPDVCFVPDFCWAGTFGSTADGLPYIGAHPGYRNCYFVLGFGGNGITFSVAAMDIVTDLIGNRPNELARIFRFGR